GQFFFDKTIIVHIATFEITIFVKKRQRGENGNRENGCRQSSGQSSKRKSGKKQKKKQLKRGSSSARQLYVSICGINLPTYSTKKKPIKHGPPQQQQQQRQSKKGWEYLVLSNNVDNLRSAALAISVGKPVLIEGPTGCGKSSMIYYLATQLNQWDRAVRIFLDDQMDAKVKCEQSQTSKKKKTHTYFTYTIYAISHFFSFPPPKCTAPYTYIWCTKTMFVMK
ncbi:hypothetical protein RFI_30326, partial [Reticulomyxa filosa]